MAGEAATPVPGGGGAAPGKSSVSVDALADGALAAMAEDLGEGAQEPAEGAEAPEPAEDPGAAEEAQETAAEGDEWADEQDADDLGGTKEKPWSINDLPTDKFVQVKIDGKMEAVPLRELADGYIRRETFDRRVNEAGEASKRAEEIANRAIEWQRTQRENLSKAMSSPDELLEYFLGDDTREGVLRQLATRYATLVKAEVSDPTKRHQRISAREQARLDAERKRFEAERQRDQEARQSAQQAAQRQQELAPGYQAGLKEAGLLSTGMTDEMKVTVRGLLHAVTQHTGKPYTADDLRQAIVKAAKVHGAQPAAAKKPAPAVVKPKERPAKPAPSNGKKPRPGSVEALLAGLGKPPRF